MIATRLLTGSRRSALRTRSGQDVVHEVDATLACLPPREMLEAGEAYLLLDDLDTFVSGSEFAHAAHAILEPSMASIAGCTVVDRSRIVNPLLDVRNLVGASSGHPCRSSG